jgi:hypothetical protein
VSLRVISVAAALVLWSACSFGRQASTAPAIGDSCVVGSWVLTEQTNQSGYTYAGAQVSVSGLAGATLTLTASGEEKESFDGSAPLIGTLSNDLRLAITIRGSIDYRIHAASGKYQETGDVVQLPTTATAGGAPVTDYHSSYSPSRGTYSCARGRLTFTTEDGNQADLWSKSE